MGSLTMLGRAAVAVTAALVAGCGDLAPPGRRGAPDAGAARPKQPVPPAEGGAPCGVDESGDWIKTDVDGDGVTAWWMRRCGQSWQIHPGIAGDNDCDDTDAARSQRSWRDADRDGFTLPTEECFAALPPGYLGRPSRDSDCDDEDPLRQQTLYVDADGDGYGANDQTQCVKFVEQGTAPPDGLSRDSRDCDDADGARHPAAYEQWNDGIDSDCNGEDAPLDCMRGDCGCQLLTLAPPMIDTTCSGADLFIAARIVCRSYCGAYNVVVVGNRGTESLPAGFDLALEGDARRLPVQGDLAPGALSLPLKLRPGPASVRVLSFPTECDATNNVAPLEAVPISCAD